MSASTLSVDDSLRDSLTSEVSELVEEVEVLGEDGAARASSHRVLVVVDGGAGAGRDNSLLHFLGKIFKFFNFKVTIGGELVDEIS